MFMYFQINCEDVRKVASKSEGSSDITKKDKELFGSFASQCGNRICSVVFRLTADLKNGTFSDFTTKQKLKTKTEFKKCSVSNDFSITSTEITRSKVSI